MKTLLVLSLFLLFSPFTQAQEVVSDEDINPETETTEEPEDLAPMETGDPQLEEAAAESEDSPQVTRKTSKSGQNVFNVECSCPEPVQAEEASPFPPNSVFFMAPQPAPVPAVEAPPKDESIPPGYGGKMPSGYDDSNYKQIQ